MNNKDIKEFLDSKVLEYNKPKFIESDPIQIPHLFSKKEDIEIAGFLTATIAWGKRQMIIKNSHRMIEIMGNSPFDFVMNHSEKELSQADSFVHRTFNGIDFQFFISSLKNIYQQHNGLEGLYSLFPSDENNKQTIHNFKKVFFEIPHQSRTTKHVSDPMKGSASKRINMFLRWMVRRDNAGVDFGLWKEIPTSKLSCPLDIHSGNVARKLGLLTRKQNDWKALEELDTTLRKLDFKDPTKYDFALFGLGVFEKF
jgi:uncharacterized protein (TIGR02757 family)